MKHFSIGALVVAILVCLTAAASAARKLATICWVRLMRWHQAQAA